MPPKPLVSILINNYNYGRFLPSAIESALRQTYSPVEILVADDGSTDDSVGVIERFGGRITPLLLQHGGQGAAVNAGVKAAQGDLIALLDSDDYFHEDKVKEVVKEYQQSPSTVLFCHSAQTVSDGNTVGKPWPSSLVDGRVDRIVRASGGWYPWPPTSCLVVNRTLAQPVFPIPEQEFPICADTFICDVAAFLGPVQFLPKALSFYRIHGGNSWNRSGMARRAVAERSVQTYQKINSSLNCFLKTAGLSPVDLGRSFMYRRAQWEMSGCGIGELPLLIELVLRYPAFSKAQRARATLGLVRSWLFARMGKSR